MASRRDSTWRQKVGGASRSGDFDTWDFRLQLEACFFYINSASQANNQGLSHTHNLHESTMIDNRAVVILSGSSDSNTLAPRLLLMPMHLHPGCSARRRKPFIVVEP